MTNPGTPLELLTAKKNSIILIQNDDELCCARGFHFILMSVPINEFLLIIWVFLLISVPFWYDCFPWWGFLWVPFWYECSYSIECSFWRSSLVPYLRKGHDFQSRGFRFRGQRVPLNLRSAIMSRVAPMQAYELSYSILMSVPFDDFLVMRVPSAA